MKNLMFRARIKILNWDFILGIGIDSPIIELIENRFRID